MIFEESVVLTGPFEEVVSQVRDALASQGFGVLTQIDASHPSGEARQDHGPFPDPRRLQPAPGQSSPLDLDPQIGVLLPCNVVVREAKDGVVVEAMDPGVIATLVGEPELKPVADEARRLMSEALTRLSIPASS
jgi:uncharacterized protein (DUF302 family)